MFFPSTIVTDSLCNKYTKYAGMLERGAKIIDNFHYTRSEAIYMLPQINTSAVVKKGNWTQRKTKLSPWMMHTLLTLWMAKRHLSG